jgi:Holliday junction resolvase RusA-like endonuclease
MIQIDVAGRPAPKGSRIHGRTKTGKSFTRPASKYEQPWVEAVKIETQIAMRHHAQPAPPYEVHLEFRLKRPQRNQHQQTWPTQHDVDKLARAVVDGLVLGGAMKDDRHVTVLTATKRYAESEEGTGCACQIRQIQAANPTVRLSV